MTDLGTVLVYILVIALAIAIRVYAGRLDRERIREYVESGGGTVLDIAWNPLGPGWSGSSERIYDVRFKTARGEMHTGTCKTSMFSGVYWTGHAPPTGLQDSDGSSATSIAEVEEPTTTPAEPITCLSCGTQIPARQTHCAKCGWSYKGA
jgi:hypothetical protein